MYSGIGLNVCIAGSPSFRFINYAAAILSTDDVIDIIGFARYLGSGEMAIPNWDIDGECSAMSKCTFHLQSATMKVDKFLGQSQTLQFQK
jgi:hypothetical protein